MRLVPAISLCAVFSVPAAGAALSERNHRFRGSVDPVSSKWVVVSSHNMSGRQSAGIGGPRAGPCRGPGNVGRHLANNFAEWEITLDAVPAGKLKLIAEPQDSAGNVEKTPHELSVVLTN